MTEVSFELTFKQMGHLDHVPWDCLWDVLEEHCAQLEKLSILLSLLGAYGRIEKLSDAEKQQMEAYIRKGCDRRIEPKLVIDFSEDQF
jgi:hypothetical protein